MTMYPEEVLESPCVLVRDQARRDGFVMLRLRIGHPSQRTFGQLYDMKWPVGSVHCLKAKAADASRNRMHKTIPKAVKAHCHSGS